MMDSATARDAQVTYNTSKLIFNSEVSVRCVLINALNDVVSDKFKRMGRNQIGTQKHTPASQ